MTVTGTTSTYRAENKDLHWKFPAVPSVSEEYIIKNVRKMVLSSLLAALTAICAWISLPIPPVAFTLQTFAVLLTLGILGGRWGTGSILIYLLLGMIGLPVFAGFQNGAAALPGPTGGFLWGFLAGGLVYWVLEKLGRIPAMIAAQLTTYICGCLWFSFYTGSIGMVAAILSCVIPYLIPDAFKLTLAYMLSTRICKQYRM